MFGYNLSFTFKQSTYIGTTLRGKMTRCRTYFVYCIIFSSFAVLLVVRLSGVFPRNWLESPSIVPADKQIHVEQKSASHFPQIKWCQPRDVSQMTFFDMTLPPFLDNFKNPCWRDSGSVTNATTISCLPYFYLAGFPKCGTTDLHWKLIKHPSISRNVMKEPHWLTRNQFIYDKTNRCSKLAGLGNYLKVFGRAVKGLQRTVNADGFHYRIFGDDSASTLWDNLWWPLINRNENLTEPRYTVSDQVHHVNPRAKILVIVRNPTNRLYSEYLYFKKVTKGPERFHQLVSKSIAGHNRCMNQHSLRRCVYHHFRQPNIEKVRIYTGIYFLHLEEWLRVFPREQIMVVKLEQFSRNTSFYMDNIFQFLDLDRMPPPVLNKLYNGTTKHANTRKVADRKIGYMMPKTRKLLNDFYKPHNQRLAELLGDEFDYNSDNESL